MHSSPRSSLKILVSAGDLSGDLLLSKILKSLKLEAHAKGISLDLSGLAGPLCEAEGVKLLVQSREVAVVGLLEVLRHYPLLRRSLKRMQAALKDCDALLCVDFPDFNFRVAEEAYRLRVPVDYVVLPQVWAWRSHRLLKMKKWLRFAYPVLPFEVDFLNAEHIPARYCGHPLLDSLPTNAESESLVENRQPILALLPGSRTSEIRKLLPVFIESWKLGRKNVEWPYKSAILPLAPGWNLDKILSSLKPNERRALRALVDQGEWILSSNSYEVMQNCAMGWIASGTASLEAALLGLPHVVVYKLNVFSVFLIKRFTNYFSDRSGGKGYVALPNLLLKEEIFPEILQGELSSSRLVLETLVHFQSAERRHRQKTAHQRLWKLLGPRGSAQRVAQALAQNYFAS